METYLRIVYGLYRFSEDLDFNLLVPNRNFTMRPALDNMIKEFADIGLDAYYRERMARGVKPIYATKISANLRQTLRLAEFDEDLVQSAHSKEDIVVKLDADTEPPTMPKSIIVHKNEPLEYDVRTEPLPTLFAGKTAAVLCREWKNRIKGRDFYDFRWYVEHRVPLDFDYLKANIDKKCNQNSDLTHETLLELLDKRFTALNWEDTKRDHNGFVEKKKIEPWNAETFKDLARRIEFEK